MRWAGSLWAFRTRIRFDFVLAGGGSGQLYTAAVGITSLRQRCSSSRAGTVRVVGIAGTLLTFLLLATGCATTSKEKDYEPVVARFYLEVPAGTSRVVPMTLPISETTISVDPRVVISEADFVQVEMVQVDLGLCLLFVMSPDTTRGLTVLTSANLGKRLVLTLNGQAVGARIIDAPVTDGRLFTFVEIPDAELPATVENLQATTADVQEAVQKAKRR